MDKVIASQNLDKVRISIAEKITEIKNRDWDFNTKRWHRNVSENQEAVRMLMHQIRFAEEAFKVAFGTDEDKRKFGPLVSRRVARPGELYAHIFSSKRQLEWPQDGSLFTFDETQIVKVQEEWCGCGQYPNPTNTAIFDVWRNSLAEDNIPALNAHMAICPNKYISTVDEPIHQTKHTIGNWDCKGCLLFNPNDDKDLEEGISKKNIDWCPRYLSSLRYMDFETYAKTINLGGTNKGCYAGLLHSQCIIDEEKVTITKKCDTCGYREDDTKTIAKQEKVEDGMTLQSFE